MWSYNEEGTFLNTISSMSDISVMLLNGIWFQLLSLIEPTRSVSCMSHNLTNTITNLHDGN